MLSELALGYELLGYGGTMRYEQRRAADLSPLPAGEGFPPWDEWLILLPQCHTREALRSALHACRSELDAWRVRPEAPPEGETEDQMARRVIDEGEGWAAKDVAVAFRCSASQVRRWRLEHERNPETGRKEGSLAHARDLISEGLSLRQVAVLTSIPKSTLHDALGQGANRQARV
jgi:hypothetical protein